METTVSAKMAKTKTTHRDKHLLLQIRKSYAKKEESHRFCPVFPVVPEFPAAHCSRPTGMCTPAVWVKNKAVLGQPELRASQHNSRNSHVLLCGAKTQKLNNMCKPAPSVAQRALIWGSPHAARKECLIL